MRSPIQLKKGDKFNNLTVIRKVRRNKYRNIVWWCECVCGRKKGVTASQLVNNKIKSCGCGWKYAPGIAGLNSVYLAYYKRAKSHKFDFSISKSDFRLLAESNCYYCGAEPSNKRTTKSSPFVYNGLDRIDNNKGYTIENVVPCCRFCNAAKSDRNIDQFINWIRNVYERVSKYPKSAERLYQS